MRFPEDCPDYRFSDSYRRTLCRLPHTFLRYRPFRPSTLDPRLPQEGGEFQIRLAGPSWGELGLLGAQEFRLEGAPTAASELSQGAHRRQTAGCRVRSDCTMRSTSKKPINIEATKRATVTCPPRNRDPRVPALPAPALTHQGARPRPETVRGLPFPSGPRGARSGRPKQRGHRPASELRPRG